MLRITRVTGPGLAPGPAPGLGSGDVRAGYALAGEIDESAIGGLAGKLAGMPLVAVPVHPVVIGPAARRLPGADLAAAPCARPARGLRLVPGELGPRLAVGGIAAAGPAGAG
ncbi:MAG TPA: hypothetical protein VF933_11305 [Streptosporangiaceae bacterium]